MYTYEELNKKSKDELVDLKYEELKRIDEGERERQELIRNILLLQRRDDLSGKLSIKEISGDCDE